MNFISENTPTMQHAASEFKKYINAVCDERPAEVRFLVEKSENEEAFSVNATDGGIGFTGGCERAVLYAVYDYFERCFGVCYFWDEDRIPARVPKYVRAEYSEAPRFRYRGQRYFAHRSLYRFQAEEWGFDDWKRELDWLIKRKFNMFMLRLGNRNAFERAFPQEVPADNTDGCKYPGQTGFYERTPIRSSRDDEELERKINEYADLLHLIRPVDCGTMTHWYSQTPESFLESYHPAFLRQSNDLYSDKRSLVWDIRNERETELYFRLTEATVNEFGNSGIFHTIGLAERLFSANREENLALKKSVYGKICNLLRTRYPGSKLLIASWDFSMFWKNEEVFELLGELDPSQCIIFDYTSDTRYAESNFTGWGVCGKFPYIFGIFHAYEPENDIRGDYGLIAERLRIAAGDEKCVGFVGWQELSHGDGMMLEYIAKNSWHPEPEKDLYIFIHDYCLGRFGKTIYRRAVKAYEALLEISRFGHWGGDRLHPERNIFRDFSLGELTSEYETPLFAPNIDEKRLAVFASQLAEYEKTGNAAYEVIKLIAEIYPLAESDGARREALDMARTAISRDIHFAMIRCALKLYAGDFSEYTKSWSDIIEKEKLFTELLGTDEDYSILSGIRRAEEHGHVNPYFASSTIKENSDNVYCRTCAYEMMCCITLPELKALNEWFCRCAGKGALVHDEKLRSDIQTIHDEYRKTDFTLLVRPGMDTAMALRRLCDKWERYH